MTERSRFWTTNTVGDDDTIDRDTWWAVLKSFMGAFELTHKSGVAWGSGDGVNSPLYVEQTSPASAAVKVNIGRAFVDGTWYENDAAMNLSIAANNDASGYARIDTIVLRKNYAAQTVRLAVLEGTPASSPTAPTLTQNTSTWEYPIANIAVANLFTTITNANITDRRTSAIQRKVQEGGTGVISIASGQLLAGSGANILSAVAAPTDYDLLVGNTSDAEQMAWVNQRPSVIVGDSAGVALGTSAAGTVIPLNTTELLDPNNWVTSIAANQFFLATGFYTFHVILPTINNAAATRSVLAWIQNATTTAVAAQGVQTRTIAANGDSIAMIYPNQIVQSNGTDAFELRAYASGASVSVPSLVSSMTPSPTGGVLGTHVQIAIRRVK